jgi:hypothetical protein
MMIELLLTADIFFTVVGILPTFIALAGFPNIKQYFSSRINHKI